MASAPVMNLIDDLCSYVLEKPAFSKDEMSLRIEDHKSQGYCRDKSEC